MAGWGWLGACALLATGACNALLGDDFVIAGAGGAPSGSGGSSGGSSGTAGEAGAGGQSPSRQLACGWRQDSLKEIVSLEGQTPPRYWFFIIGAFGGGTNFRGAAERADIPEVDLLSYNGFSGVRHTFSGEVVYAHKRIDANHVGLLLGVPVPPGQPNSGSPQLVLYSIANADQEGNDAIAYPLTLPDAFAGATFDDVSTADFFPMEDGVGELPGTIRLLVTHRTSAADEYRVSFALYTGAPTGIQRVTEPLQLTFETAYPQFLFHDDLDANHTLIGTPLQEQRQYSFADTLAAPVPPSQLFPPDDLTWLSFGRVDDTLHAMAALALRELRIGTLPMSRIASLSADTFHPVDTSFVDDLPGGMQFEGDVLLSIGARQSMQTMAVAAVDIEGNVLANDELPVDEAIVPPGDRIRSTTFASEAGNLFGALAGAVHVMWLQEYSTHDSVFYGIVECEFVER